MVTPSATQTVVFGPQACNTPTARVTVCYMYDNKKRTARVANNELQGLVAIPQRSVLAPADRS